MTCYAVCGICRHVQPYNALVERPDSCELCAAPDHLLVHTADRIDARDLATGRALPPKEQPR